MADVYLARVTGLADFERRFAVKMIRADVEDPQRFGQFFIDEARITVHLQHANITQVFDLGLHDGSPYLGMEYIDGPDLNQFVEWSRSLRGGVPYNLAVFVAREVLQGLSYAHEARRPDGQPMAIVHRDISPHNILLATNGGVKLSDFGVAQASIASEAQGAGFVVGKAAYLAPEVARGEAASPRSDLFSLGATLFYLFTGEMLIQAATYERTLLRLARFDLDERLDQVMSLPAGLEPVLRGALQPDPGARFESAKTMLDHMEDYIYAEGVRATRNDLAVYLEMLDENMVRDELSISDMLDSDEGEEMSESNAALEDTVARPANWSPMLPEEAEPALPPGWDTSEILVLPDADRVTLFDPAHGPWTMSGEAFDDLLEDVPPEYEILVRFDDSEIKPFAEWIQEGNPRADLTTSALPLDSTPLTLGPVLTRLMGGESASGAIQAFSGDALVVLLMERGSICGAWDESTGPELLDHLVARGVMTGAQLDVLRGLARGSPRSLSYLAVERRLIQSNRLWKEARAVIAEHVLRLLDGPSWRLNRVSCPSAGWGRDRAGVPLLAALQRAGEQRFTPEWFLGLHGGLLDAPLTVDSGRLETQADLQLTRAQIQLAWSVHRGSRVREVIAGPDGKLDPGRTRDLFLLILSGVVQPYLADGVLPERGLAP